MPADAGCLVRAIVPLLWAAAAVAGAAAEEKPAPVQTPGKAGAAAPAEQERLALLVRRLGSDDYRERERAGDELAEAGERALPLLRAAAGSDDPEVAARAAKLVEAIEAVTKSSDLLRPAMEAAAKAYIQALRNWRDPSSLGLDQVLESAKNTACEAHARSSGAYFEALIREAQVLPAGSEKRKAASRRIAEQAAAWVKLHDTVFFEDSAFASVYLGYVLGRAHALAGKPDDALKELDKVVATNLADYDAGPAQDRAARSKARAVCFRAELLADAARRSDKAEDWRRALDSIVPEISSLCPGEPGLAVRARALRALCLAKLGAREQAGQELAAAQREVLGVRGIGSGALRAELEKLRAEVSP